MPCREATFLVQRRQQAAGASALAYVLCAAPNVGDPKAAYTFCLCYIHPGSTQLTKARCFFGCCCCCG